MIKRDYTGKGNSFSRAHRKLESWRLMSDLDYLEGSIDLGPCSFRVCGDTENKLYAEYSISRPQGIPQARVTALFDFKGNSGNSARYAQSVGSSTWFQRDLARQLGARFFLVEGTEGEFPLRFTELTSSGALELGVLSSEEPAALRDFWRSVLRL